MRDNCLKAEDFMVSEKLAERIKNDEEAQELRRKEHLISFM